MKFLILFLSIGLIACSSTKEKSPKEKLDKITNESFKKERTLLPSEVKDFYEGNGKSLNPALQDETLDRHSRDEASKLVNTKDALGQIALKCSQGEYASAFEIAAQAFSSYQKVAAYWNQVANCHLNQGSHRKALLFYNKALEVSPEYVPALNNIGVLYSRTGQDQKALVAFERANKKSSFSKTPRYNLAKLYLTYGLSEQALTIFESLLRNSPLDLDLLNSTASSYFLMSEYQKAMDYYLRIPKKFWSFPEVGINIAFTLKKLGKRDEALKVFENITKPKSSDLNKYYSVVQSQLGDQG